MFYPRKLTAAEWLAANITLKNGEIGIEKDTKKRKIGNGFTPWDELEYQFDRAAASVLFATKAEVAALASGTPLVEDSEDPGTFIIMNNALTEDPTDPGTFLIGV